MKTFLTICICAMVSAGIYGFADMAVDVKNGTMIEYEHGENADEKTVTVAMLKKGLTNTQNSISKDVADFDLSDRIIKAKSSKKKVIAVSAFYTDLSESYSRGNPSGREPMVYEPTKAILTTSLDSKSPIGTISSLAVSTSEDVSFVKKPLQETVAISNSTEEILLTSANVDSVPRKIKSDEGIDWSLYSRGAPRKKRPVKVVSTPSIDSTTVVSENNNDL